MWQRMPKATPERISIIRRMSKQKIYADEDIEDEAIDYLRQNRVNIKSTRECGNQGKPDSFQVAYAFKQDRVILTKNGKDFLNHKIAPFNRIHGIIVVEGSMKNVEPYYEILGFLIDFIVPRADVYRKTKIIIADKYVTVLWPHPDGRIAKDRFRYAYGSSNIDKWVEPS